MSIKLILILMWGHLSQAQGIYCALLFSQYRYIDINNTLSLSLSGVLMKNRKKATVHNRAPYICTVIYPALIILKVLFKSPNDFNDYL